MKEALERELFQPNLGRFARAVLYQQGGPRLDSRLDASLLGLAIFGALDANDARLVETARQIEERLWVRGPVGGLARYEGDRYQLALGANGIPGNPWVVCTLWLAQYQIARARDRATLDQVLALLRWTAERALASGVLPEQVDARSGAFLSVSPLTWSHATFVSAVLDYVDRLRALRQVRPPAQESTAPARAKGGERWI